jgi:1-acylglycerone phosphate reductase
MRVFATARSTASLSTLEDKGIGTFALDVTNAASIAALRDEIVKRTGGKLDMLFNNAGTSTSNLLISRGLFDILPLVCIVFSF